MNLNPQISMFILPGGKRPQRMSADAIGFDVYTRAIVCPCTMDPERPYMRNTLFDFKTTPANRRIASSIFKLSDGNLGYHLRPGEIVNIGLGFVVEMEFPLMMWIAPRSGLASRSGITIANAPGTVDPDYRGECCAVLYNASSVSFPITPSMRVAQAVFQWVAIPTIHPVPQYADLSHTIRSADGLGSTGLQ